MSSATMARRMVDVAETLLEEGAGSTAFRRRAVSTAYYAVFHALARACSDYLTHAASRTLDEYERVYRSLEHGPLKQAFAQAPLKDNRRLSEIGQSVVRLQAERFRADYLPPVAGVFTQGQAEELVALARETVEQIEQLVESRSVIRVLATAPYFKSSRVR